MLVEIYSGISGGTLQPTLHHAATRRITLQHTATHCSTLQHTCSTRFAATSAGLRCSATLGAAWSMILLSKTSATDIIEPFLKHST